MCKNIVYKFDPWFSKGNTRAPNTNYIYFSRDYFCNVRYKHKYQTILHQQCFRLRGVPFQRHGCPLCQGLIYLRANVHDTDLLELVAPNGANFR
jgi:hypothetical protein